jgi:hypothetical protein
MLRKLRSRISYANVVATLALFVAVGTGSAYAANTVFSTDIVDGEVKSVDIGNNEIGSGDVKDNSLNTFDVHSFLGADVVDETLTGDDIKDGYLTGNDVAANSIYGADIFEGTLAFNDGLVSTDICDLCLKDQDVGQGTFVNFDANIGTVPAQSCTYRSITGINAQGDHLLLTGNLGDTHTDLSYGIEYSPTESRAAMKICNPTPSNIDDGHTHFNLLVFDAQ